MCIDIYSIWTRKKKSKVQVSVYTMPPLDHCVFIPICSYMLTHLWTIHGMIPKKKVINSGHLYWLRTHVD